MYDFQQEKKDIVDWAYSIDAHARKHGFASAPDWLEHIELCTKQSALTNMTNWRNGNSPRGFVMMYINRMMGNENAR